MPAPSAERNSTVYELFRASVIFKAVGAAGEMIGGLLIAVLPSRFVLHLTLLISQGDLGNDADDWVTRELRDFAHFLTVSNLLVIGLYLFMRGLIQVVLTYQLFKNRLWAYPALLFVMLIFVLTQIYNIYNSYSLATTALTIFDFVTMYLIWREYWIVKKSVGHGV